MRTRSVLGGVQILISGYSDLLTFFEQQKQTPKRYSPTPLARPPRIPSLALPKATFATFRKVSGIGHEIVDNNTLGSRLEG
jgi:hypothetical protein